MCEAFRLTAARAPDQVALRTPGRRVSLTFAAAARAAERPPRRPPRPRPAARRHVRAHARQPARVPRRRRSRRMHLGATPFIALQHLAGRADRLRDAATRRNRAGASSAPPRFAGTSVARGRRRRRAGRRARRARRGGDEDFDLEAHWRAVEPERRADAHLHLRHDRSAEGRELTHANMLAELRGDARGGAAGRAAGAGLVPALRPHRRPLGLPLLRAHDLRLHGDAGGGPDAGHAVVAQVRPTALRRRPAGVGEAQGGAGGVRAPRRCAPDDAARAPRPRRGAAGWRSARRRPRSRCSSSSRRSACRICEVWGMSETSCIVDDQPPGRDALRLGRPAGRRHGAAARRRRRAARPRPARHDRLPQPARPDRARPIDADGWLHTGDIARIDEDGFVWIVDRKKELIINAAGKNMSPANIEARLKAAAPLIGQAVRHRRRRPYNVALLVLDPDGPPASTRRTPTSSRASQEAVDAANATCRAWSRSSASASLAGRVAARWRRADADDEAQAPPIAEKYAGEIDALYA